MYVHRCGTSDLERLLYSRFDTHDLERFLYRGVVHLTGEVPVKVSECATHDLERFLYM